MNTEAFRRERKKKRKKVKARRKERRKKRRKGGGEGLKEAERRSKGEILVASWSSLAWKHDISLNKDFGSIAATAVYQSNRITPRCGITKHYQRNTS